MSTCYYIRLNAPNELYISQIDFVLHPVNGKKSTTCIRLAITGYNPKYHTGKIVKEPRFIGTQRAKKHIFKYC